MWFLHTSKLVLHQFTDVNIPYYAILSHAWGAKITFADLKKQRKTGKPPKGARYEKIMGCCAKARSDGFEYVWIDTCCINKEQQHRAI